MCALFTVCTVLAMAQINTDQVMRIGRNSLYFEDYVLSIQYFNQAIKAKPFLAEPYFYRAVAKINLEDYRGAEADATLAIDRNPFIVDAYQVRGIARQNMGDFEGAVSDYNEGLKLMPVEKVFLLNRAVCLCELKRYDESQSSYDELLAIDSQNDRAYLGLAHLNLERADTTAALANVERCLELSKNNVNAYAMRADVMMQRKQWSEALADLDQAITLEPHYAGYFINRAYMKYNLDDYFGAMADYDYALSLDPNSVEAHFNRGLLRAEVGDNAKAIEDFSYVLETDANNFMALYNRAMLFMQSQRFREAVADLDRVLEKYPQFEAGYMMRGGAKAKMGNMRGSQADYDRAMAILDKKKTRTSDFNPARIEAEKAAERAEKLASGELQPEEESDEDIAKRFTSLLTVETDSRVKPEYENKARGHVQNTDMNIEPEPMFLLSYLSHDNKLNGNTYYMREVDEANATHLLPEALTLASGELHLNEDDIARYFNNIDYYNGLLATATPRPIDYLARGVDLLMVRNLDGALADADRALELKGDFALAYFLRANVRFMQWRMSTSAPASDATDARTQAMLHQSEQAALLQAVLSDLDQVLRLSPGNVYANFNRGNAYALLADYTAAISCFNKAIEAKPDLGQAYYNRGLAYLQLGNKARGMADLSKAGELGILPSYNIIKRMNR